MEKNRNISDETVSDEFEYVAFVDEAGDPNISRVRPLDERGGSEWIVLSAVLIRRSNQQLVNQWHKDLLLELNITQTQHLHFRRLNERQKQHACDFIAKLPVRLFLVASNKRTMRGHTNLRAEIRGGRQPFYNWMIRLLLERMTHYCARRSKRDKTPGFLKLFFATTGMHSYSQTAAYHELMKTQARAQNVYLDQWVPDYSVLKPKSLSALLAKDLAGLQFADVVASAFYTAIDNLDTGPCVLDYALKLKPRVAFYPWGSHMDYGVVLQPTRSNPMSFQPDQRAIFEHFGYGFDNEGLVL